MPTLAPPPWMGCCLACGYDLQGLNEGARCPECGEEPGVVERLAAPSKDPQYGQTYAVFNGGWLLLCAAISLLQQSGVMARVVAALYGTGILVAASFPVRRGAKGTVRYLLPRLHRARRAAVGVGVLVLLAAVVPPVPVLSLPANRLLVVSALLLAGLTLRDCYSSFADLAERWDRPRLPRWCRSAGWVAPGLAVAEAAVGLSWLARPSVTAMIVLFACNLAALPLVAPPLLLDKARRPPRPGRALPSSDDRGS